MHCMRKSVQLLDRYVPTSQEILKCLVDAMCRFFKNLYVWLRKSKMNAPFREDQSGGDSHSVGCLCGQNSKVPGWKQPIRRCNVNNSIKTGDLYFFFKGIVAY